MEINFFFFTIFSCDKDDHDDIIYIYIYNLFINIENIYIYLKIENNKKIYLQN